MEIAIRYQTRGNNTKAVAQEIADNLGVKAESISQPLSRSADILFLGGGVYKSDIDESLKDYLNNLDPRKVKTLVVFSTAGMLNVGIKIISNIAKAKGIKVSDQTLLIRMGFKNHAMIGGKGNVELSERQKTAIKNFTDKIAKKS
jgi:flavodoxin